MPDNKFLVCRKFDTLDDTYKVFELALPVEICECSAYRVTDRELDTLAEAVLELMNIEIIDGDEISRTLDISTDLVSFIKRSVLHNHSYISNDFKMVTKQGKEYLVNGESTEFQRVKVFGNMFVSILDGEVMPYFLEGNLPTSRFLPREMFKMLSPHEDKKIVQDNAKWTPKFAKAYKLYAKISRYSDEDINEIEFAAEEFTDVSYEEVNDLENEIITLADVDVFERKSASEFHVIKLLNTVKRQTYIKTKIVINRENPEIFTVLSPFDKNVTNWYTKRLTWLRENNAIISDESGKVRTLNQMLEDITEEFYIEFPDLQTGNFDYWLSIKYPNLKRIKRQQYLMDSFKSLYNLKNFYENSSIEATQVIIKYQKLLETVFNNYIEISTNISAILRRFSSFAKEDNMKVIEIFNYYGIKDCGALRRDKWKESLRNLRRSKYGSSVTDRYFYLIIDAYFSDKTPFKLILEKDAPGFINKLDYLNRTRNRYGAHSDDVVETSMSKEDFEKYDSIMNDVIKVLINALFEEEQILD